MKICACLTLLAAIALVPNLSASNLTPANIQAPFAVQPSAGLLVTSGMTGPFFSVLASPPFTSPGIIDILANIQAIDNQGNLLSSFAVTGVTVMQGSSLFSPPLQTFFLSSPITYTDSVNPLNSAMVVPGNLNLAFQISSNSTFEYSYVLAVTGIPDGGFLLYDDIEGAVVPEPGTWILLGAVAIMLASSRKPLDITATTRRCR
jgi:hypothetical protein